MAKYLYRLGQFAARRAWIVVVAWVLILGAVGGAAATLREPFTSKLSIPGTEFQNVIDDLQKSSPDAAHGSGTVVFSTTDGNPFTAVQKKAVAQTVKDWSSVDGVDDAADPFHTQQKLDDARTKISDGKQKLADADKQIADNEKKLADGKAKIADGKKALNSNAAKITDGRRQLTAAQATITSGQAAIDTNRAKLTSGEKQLATAEAKLAKGKTQIAAAKKQIAAGQQKLNAAKAEISNGETQIADAREQVRAGQAQLDRSSADADALAKELGEDDPQVVAARAAIAKQQATLDATSKTLDDKSAQLAAGKKTLAAKQKELTAGAATLEEKSAELSAGERKLAAADRKLASGKAQLSAGQAKLTAGQATIDANRAKLSDGSTKIAEGRKELTSSAKKIADGQQKLADAKKTLADKSIELVQGERKLALMDGLRAVSKDGATAVTTISFDVPLNEVSDTTKEAIPTKATGLAAVGVNVDYSSDISPTPSAGGTTEAVGVGIAAVVLLVMLGSLLAAGLPLIIAMVGVGVGLLSVLALSHWVTMTDVTPVLALMLGLAVGIDYALFLVHRHRTQLAQGVELKESIARATGTAGGAVLFAGTTVVVALSALTLTKIPFLGVMGLAAAGTVAVAILVALTLTPALLSLIGPRVLSRRGRRKLAAAQVQQDAAAAAEDTGAPRDPAHAQHGRGRGWGGLVTRHPVITVVATAAVLGLLAIPAASLKLGLPDGSAEAHNTTAYRAYTKVTDSFGAGQNAAIIGVAKLDGDEADRLTDDQATDLQLDIAEQLKRTPDVAYVVPASISDDHRTMVFQIVPETGPNDDATIALVHQLRADRQTIIDETAVDSLGYAGQTVANIDISDRLADVLPLYLGVVVGISLLLLLLVFRSIVVPLLATGGFLLSIAAAFGAVVAVYQWGWLGPVFGVAQPGLILSFLPTLAIGILFGLAMDYQMFLVSGMREAWSHGQTARTAVRTGFNQGAKVVTAAALIMTSVFASFIFADQTMIKPIGFVLAIGVLIDAFGIRMTLMPALMHLLGEKAWYIPRWLDKILPDLDVEGAKLVEAPSPSADSDAPAESDAPADSDAPAESDAQDESDGQLGTEPADEREDAPTERPEVGSRPMVPVG